MTLGRCGWIGVPGVGLLIGGAGGFVVGQLARVVLVRDESVPPAGRHW